MELDPKTIEKTLLREKKKANRVDTNLEARQRYENMFVIGCMRGDSYTMGEGFFGILRTYQEKKYG